MTTQRETSVDTLVERTPDEQIAAALGSGARPDLPGPVSSSLSFALAGAAQDQARPRAALRRDDVPDHVHADVHVRVRRRDRGLAAGLPAVRPARDPHPDGRLHHDVHRADHQHRHREGGLRPVPLAAGVAALDAGRRPARRHAALRDGLVHGAGGRGGDRLPRPRRHRRGAARGGAAAGLLLRAQLGVADRRLQGPHPQRGHGRLDDGAVPADLHQLGVRPAGDDAGAGCAPSSTSTR